MELFMVIIIYALELHFLHIHKIYARQEGVDAHAHSHSIILYACSAHVQCQGPGSDTIERLLDKS